MARFETHTVGSQVLVLPKDLQYTPPSDSAGELHRRAGQRQAAKAPHPAQRPVQRRSLPAPRDDRHHRHAAHRGRNTPTFSADQRSGQAGEAGRPICLERKEFSEIWAMKWAELLMVRSTNDVSYKSMFLYLRNWLTAADSEQRALEQDGARAARRQRRHVQEPGHELLPDRTRHAEDGRERGPGLHGHSHAMRPVPQSSVRPLDDERLLQLRRVLLPDRPQDVAKTIARRSSSTPAAAK